MAPLFSHPRAARFRSLEARRCRHFSRRAIDAPRALSRGCCCCVRGPFRKREPLSRPRFFLVFSSRRRAALATPASGRRAAAAGFDRRPARAALAVILCLPAPLLSILVCAFATPSCAARGRVCSLIAGASVGVCFSRGRCKNLPSLRRLRQGRPSPLPSSVCRALVAELRYTRRLEKRRCVVKPRDSRSVGICDLGNGPSLVGEARVPKGRRMRAWLHYISVWPAQVLLCTEKRLGRD